MQEFINKFRDQINGVLSGFDRLVFRGTLRRLNYGYWDQKLDLWWRRGWSSTCGRTRFCSRITWIM